MLFFLPATKALLLLMQSILEEEEQIVKIWLELEEQRREEGKAREE